METDYSPFLQVNEDGSIWWALLNAVKLGAGYLPVRDNERNLVPVLRTAEKMVLVNEKNLLSEFGPTHYTAAHPRTSVRDDTRFVEAGEFVAWLAGYVKIMSDPAFPFPAELARAVRDAKQPTLDGTVSSSSFVRLTISLADWFDRPFCELPHDLQARVKSEMFGVSWDELSQADRLEQAAQSDEGNDPARRFFQKIQWEMGILGVEIADKVQQQKLSVTTSSATDKANLKVEIAELEQKLRMMMRLARSEERRLVRAHASPAAVTAVNAGSPKYLAYPRALKLFETRLGATKHELAMWVYMGPEKGGIAAYINANESRAPARFQYGIGVGSEADFDYLAQLVGCWFREDELANFNPTDRYLTGRALLARWEGVRSVDIGEFIRAKIRGSDLRDFHPTTHSTQASEVGNDAYPPLTAAIFLRSNVEGIEANQFADDFVPIDTTWVDLESSPKAAKPIVATISEAPTVALTASDDSCSEFRAMEGLTADELTIAFVGDTSESGLVGNNMLEISARGTSRRVSLAEFDLVNRTTGVLNAQAAVLVGLTRQLKLSRSDSNQQKMSRLRRLLRRHLGIRDEPFEGYRPSIGWLPRFTIVDRRGAADERAKQDALRKTTSIEAVLEGRAAIESGQTGRDDFDDESDDAGVWLNKH